MNNSGSPWRQYTEIMLKVVALFTLLQFVHHLTHSVSMYLQVLDLTEEYGFPSARWRGLLALAPGMMLAVPALLLFFGSKRGAAWLSPAPDVFETNRRRLFRLAIQSLGFFFLIYALYEAAVGCTDIAVFRLFKPATFAGRLYDQELIRFAGPVVRIFAGALLAFEGHRIVVHACPGDEGADGEYAPEQNQTIDSETLSHLLFCGIGLYLLISGFSGFLHGIFNESKVNPWLRGTVKGNRLIPIKDLIKALIGAFLFLRPTGISRLVFWLRRAGHDKHPGQDKSLAAPSEGD